MPSQARPADSSTEADNQTKLLLLLGLRDLFSLLVPFLAGWRFISRSLLLSFSFTPFCLIIIVIPYEIIRGYILSASASLLTVLIIPICSVFPPCLVLTCLCLLFLDGCSTHQGTNPLLLSSDVIHQLDSHFCFPRGLCLLLQQRT